MSPAAERAKAAYQAGEAGRPCPGDADARARRMWMLGRSRCATGGVHHVSQAGDVDMLDRLNAIAANGDLTDDEARERDALRARLGLLR